MYQLSLYDNSGNPVTTATPTVVVYKDIAGVNHTPPSILNIGGGIYILNPPSGDEVAGRGAIIDAGVGNNPRYSSVSIGFQAQFFAIFDGNGSPLAGAGPSISTYKLFDTSNVVPIPTVLDLGGGLYGFIPNTNDRTLNTLFEGSISSINAVPSRFNGILEGASNTSAATITLITATENTIDIAFNSTIVSNSYILNNDNWAITGGHYNVAVISVSIVGNIISLVTSNMVNGITYNLILPDIGIYNISGYTFGGPFLQPFIPSGSPPSIFRIDVIDSRTLQIMFDRPVNELDATNENNYAIIPTLRIHNGIQKISQSIYRLTTDPQAVGTSYTITASNIRDY